MDERRTEDAGCCWREGTRSEWDAYSRADSGYAACDASWYAPADAAYDERRWRHAGDDEGHDARAGWRSARHGGDATYVSTTRIFFSC